MHIHDVWFHSKRINLKSDIKKKNSTYTFFIFQNIQFSKDFNSKKKKLFP